MHEPAAKLRVDPASGDDGLISNRKIVVVLPVAARAVRPVVTVNGGAVP